VKMFVCTASGIWGKQINREWKTCWKNQIIQKFKILGNWGNQNIRELGKPKGPGEWETPKHKGICKTPTEYSISYLES